MTLREALIRDEGTRLFPYLDCCGKRWRECGCVVKGKLTIAHGRNLDDIELSLAEAAVLLDADITRASAAVLSALPWARSLDEPRREVLIAMAFNMGIGGLTRKNPKMLAACEQGDYVAAAAEMLDGPWKSQVGPRAFRLADQMRDGVRR